MKIISAGQPKWGPANKPKIVSPVVATLDVPVFYATERGPIPSARGIICGQAFAETALLQLSTWCQEYGFALVHVGVYNPRQARKRDGSLIQPARWSNHAYAEAMDWAGIITSLGEGQWLRPRPMRAGIPAKLAEVLATCENAIRQAGRCPEIVDEGGWIHVGVWPAG